MYISVPSYNIDYKVMVRCATYNHSKYIQETLNGFAIQNTDFPFICIVVDDASSDGNQEVIRRYANENCNISKAEISEDDISKYIRVSHKRNANCFFLFCLLKVNLYGKPEKKEIYKPYRAVCEYEAPCEGDDYWIDPLKLQKQVDFFEKNPDYGLVYGRAKEFLQDKEKFGNLIGGKATSFEDIFFKGNPVPTLTACYRVKFLNEYRENMQLPNFAMGDLPMWLYISKHYSIHFIDEVLGVYRVLKNSASGRISYDARLRFIQSSFDVRRFFCDYYKLPYMNSLDEFKARVYYLSAKEFGQIEDMRKHYVCIKNKLSIKERVVHYLYILGIVGNKG